MLAQFAESTSLLVVILNPFLMTVYLMDVIRSVEKSTFRRMLARAALISGVVFAAFAVTGDAIFRNVLHVRFASFAIFGGVVFLVIGIRFVLMGPGVIEELRGRSAHVAGSIAMPFMIGPGTVNASVLAGAQLPAWAAVLAVATALTSTVVMVLLLRYIHDHVRERYAELVERYVDVIGRISALVMGTFAVEMILSGIDLWRSGG